MEGELKFTPLAGVHGFRSEVAPGGNRASHSCQLLAQQGYEQFPVQPGAATLVIVFCTCPICAMDFMRLKVSSTCHRSRYASSICSVLPPQPEEW